MDTRVSRFSARSATMLLVCLGVWLPVMTALASSLRQVGVDEMAEVCEFIFEGRVVGQQVKAGPAGDIHTAVTFEVLDVLKGDYPEETVELRFLGGRLGERSVKITDMRLPPVGEQGIYFVESLEKDLVNPLCAWDQGHFVVEQDLTTGATVVKTSRRLPIYGIEPVQAGRRKELSRGIASGVRLQHAPHESALTVQDFKQQVRALIPGAKP